MNCYFCHDEIDEDGDDEYGEFWSAVLRRAVVAHPDCLPMGIDATQQGIDPEWSTA